MFNISWSVCAGPWDMDLFMCHKIPVFTPLFCLYLRLMLVHCYSHESHSVLVSTCRGDKLLQIYFIIRYWGIKGAVNRHKTLQETPLSPPQGPASTDSVQLETRIKRASPSPHQPVRPWEWIPLSVLVTGGSLWGFFFFPHWVLEFFLCWKEHPRTINNYHIFTNWIEFFIHFI